MSNDEPIAFFITWTVYGTFLQGHQRGWHRRKQRNQAPQPQLAAWRRGKLKHAVLLLEDAHQAVVESEIERLAAYRHWHVWTKNARTNHVHVIVTARGFTGGKVRDQLKANCTRALRERWPQFAGRPVWTAGGDWRFVNNEEALEQAVVYVGVAQDRMQFNDRKSSAAGGSPVGRSATRRSATGRSAAGR